AGVATGAIPYLRRQHRVGHHRGDRLHARSRSGQPGGRVALQASRHSFAAATRRHRTVDGHVWNALARYLRPRRNACPGHAVAAYCRERRGALPGPEESRQISAASSPILRFSSILGLACASGFISLSYEIFFFRTLSYATGSSATAFAATLGAFLVGLASGSREAGVLCASAAPNVVVKRVVARLIVASVIGWLFLPVLEHM